MDAFQEFYHAPVLHARQRPGEIGVLGQQMGFEALHYELDGPHRVVSTSGMRPGAVPDDALKPTEVVFRSGLFGPWEQPDLGDMPAGLNPGGAPLGDVQVAFDDRADSRPLYLHYGVQAGA